MGVERKMRLVVLSDNRVGESRLPVEHGFSAWIESGPDRVLFDTGGGTLFADNARALGIRWFEAGAVVLSHGHYDHSGGVAHALSGDARAKWVLHPDALLPRYRERAPKPPKPIGMPPACREALEAVPGRILHATQTLRLSEDLFVTGPIPRRIPEEDVGGPFFLDASCTLPDPLVDDQALWARVEGGVVAVMGCAHAGVGNTLDHVARLSGERILAVVGGFHLQGQGAGRLAKAVEAFRRHGVRWIRPAHCTGEAAVTVLERNFPDAVSPCGAGSVFEW